MRRAAAVLAVLLAAAVPACRCLEISGVPSRRAEDRACPAGTAWHTKSKQCLLCGVGTYSGFAEGAVRCVACPPGRTTRAAGSHGIDSCVCEPGFGRAAYGTCERCPVGTFNFGDTYDACMECPFPKTTAFSGATSDADCICPGGSGTGPACDQCPPHMELMENGICGCVAGYGGSSCECCKAGYYSPGGTPNNPRPACKPCGRHFTSPPGSVSSAWCECDAGFGAAGEQHDATLRDSSGSSQCQLCPIGTYNPGRSSAHGVSVKAAALGSSSAQTAAVGVAALGGRHRRRATPVAEPCRLCNATNPQGGFMTQQVGSKSAADCMCAPGYGGASCSACAKGTYSEGGRGAMCTSCPGEGAGFTTVAAASTSIADCVCLPGYGMEANGRCHLCPQNTWAEGLSKENCKPCPFGTTSPAGSTAEAACAELRQACPAGMVAPGAAVTADQCVCMPGFGSPTGEGPCRICPVGSYSPGESTEDCLPCPFGKTSQQGATDASECRPITQQCPAAGQIAPPDAVSEAECRCLPGHGGTGTRKDPCKPCEPGSWAPGTDLQPCISCGWGFTSPAAATSEMECVAVHTCPEGQIAPPGAVSAEQCLCRPGFGGTGNSKDACTACQPGTWSAGTDTEACRSCGWGFTSPTAATRADQCVAVHACPEGQVAPPGAVSGEQCACKPGFGGTGDKKEGCKPCAPGSWSAGKTTDPCVSCGWGFTSPAAATHPQQCVAVHACPEGQVAPPGAVSGEQCVCKPGFGGTGDRKDACKACEPGTWAPGGTTEACKACGWGFTSAAAASSKEQCVAVHECPAGQLAPPGAVSVKQCGCKPGFGLFDAAKQGAPCERCPSGYFSRGGKLEACTPCPFGYTSAKGATSIHECVAFAQACPVGQIVDPDIAALSADDCHCLPGFGSHGPDRTSPCKVCPPGSFSPGIGTQPCIPCGFGFTSPTGSITEAACYEVDQCPGGTYPSNSMPSTRKECWCLPGFGSQSGELGAPCFFCPSNTYNEGDNWESCKPCQPGFISLPGATACVNASEARMGGNSTDYLTADYPSAETLYVEVIGAGAAAAARKQAHADAKQGLAQRLQIRKGIEGKQSGNQLRISFSDPSKPSSEPQAQAPVPPAAHRVQRPRRACPTPEACAGLGSSRIADDAAAGGMTRAKTA